jgi:hypothetical protein
MVVKHKNIIIIWDRVYFSLSVTKLRPYTLDYIYAKKYKAKKQNSVDSMLF